MRSSRTKAALISLTKTFALELETLGRVREEFPNLQVMIPFVRTAWELEACLEAIDAGAAGERGGGQRFIEISEVERDLDDRQHGRGWESREWAPPPRAVNARASPAPQTRTGVARCAP